MDPTHWREAKLYRSVWPSLVGAKKNGNRGWATRCEVDKTSSLARWEQYAAVEVPRLPAAAASSAAAAAPRSASWAWSCRC